MKRTRRKRLLTVSLTLVLLFTAAYAYNTWNYRNINNNPQFEAKDSDVIAIFPFNDSCTMVSTHGAKVNFDMGSRHSFITVNTLEKIMADDPSVDLRHTVVLTRDQDGHLRFYTTIATIDIKLPNAEGCEPYYIRNVELLVTDDAQGNIFGMDLMKHLAVEHHYSNNELVIYKNAPAEGYIKVCDITLHDNALGDLFGATDRASVSLSVNEEEPREYFFDTGGLMRGYELVQPESCRENANGTTEIEERTGFWLQPNCRVAFGNRIRFSNVVYADNLHTDAYSVNPFKLFDQDCVIDLKGQNLLIKKTKQK